MNETKMQILRMLLDDSQQKVEDKKKNSFEAKKQIVIAQRGWVFIGNVEKKESNFVIKDASVVRVWGTTKGLGEIAKSGPIKDKTILDSCPDVTIHELSIIARIDCEF